MPPVRRAYCGDAGCMRRGREPVEHCGADFATSDGVITRSGMAGNQEHHALSGGDGAIECIVDRSPGLVQVTAVQIQHPVRLHRPRAEPSIPAGI